MDVKRRDSGFAVSNGYCRVNKANRTSSSSSPTILPIVRDDACVHDDFSFKTEAKKYPGISIFHSKRKTFAN